MPTVLPRRGRTTSLQPRRTGIEKPVDEVAHLLAYVRERDVPCPLCGYNLRDLTGPRCPECRHDLVLAVGVTRPHFLWLLVTIAPCIFSGMAAGLLLFPIFMSIFVGGILPPWQIFAAETFGWVSALAGFLLVWKRYAFLRQSRTAQRRWAVGAWAIHVTAFLGLIAAAILWG
jgi:hypothetical protein